MALFGVVGQVTHQGLELESPGVRRRPQCASYLSADIDPASLGLSFRGGLAVLVFNILSPPPFGGGKGIAQLAGNTRQSAQTRSSQPRQSKLEADAADTPWTLQPAE